MERRTASAVFGGAFYVVTQRPLERPQREGVRGAPGALVGLGSEATIAAVDP